MGRDERKLRYAKTHEWVDVQGTKAVVGITAFAAKELQDLVFVDLPQVGTALAAGEAFGSIESVKAVSDLYAPVSGKVVKVNGALEDAPELVSSDAYGEGWMLEIEVTDASNVSNLMTKEAYHAMVTEEKAQ
ncbi:MAG: glycine cleavage system protein GcvH [Planctomycetota bacterium]